MVTLKTYLLTLNCRKADTAMVFNYEYSINDKET